MTAGTARRAAATRAVSAGAGAWLGAECGAPGFGPTFWWRPTRDWRKQGRGRSPVTLWIARR